MHNVEVLLGSAGAFTNEKVEAIALAGDPRVQVQIDGNTDSAQLHVS